jgi:hypothetical protein
MVDVDDCNDEMKPIEDTEEVGRNEVVEGIDVEERTTVWEGRMEEMEEVWEGRKGRRHRSNM